MSAEDKDVKTKPIPTSSTNDGKETVKTNPIPTSLTFNDKSKEKK